MKVFATHGDDDIHIDLEVVPNPLLYGESVCRIANPPPFQLTPREGNTGTYEKDRPGTARTCLLGVARLDLWKGVECFHNIDSRR